LNSREAFIHSSNNSLPNNQRLTFLGDSVLKLIIREYFYNNYRDWNKGELTKICDEKESNKNFANIAIKIGLIKCMDIKNRPPETETHERLNSEALDYSEQYILIGGFRRNKKNCGEVYSDNLGDY
jgi:dsRNA-specific ribonuclease